ncbi:MAG TPA: benzoyl-CoA reductase subunit C [Candidatus Polarisedimenticolia bacterium]|nr:benzoyl-CoA reductase subunit C [Candidatus Polarisedimenticolia bacterium]
MDTRVADDPSERKRSAVVERVETLYRDLEFGAVREWKKKHAGALAIGYMPVYVPREIIHAAGMLPVGVLGGDLEIVKGDACFQSYICHIPRSTIELGMNGALDCLDGMIFPSICDVIRNLSGMWQILFPGKYVRYFDVPQNFSDAIGGQFYERELRGFIAELEALSGGKVEDDALRRSIGLYNENRRRVEAMYALRADRPWVVPSSELYLIMRAGALLDVEAHSALLDEYLDAARASRRPPMDMARVALRGTFCEQPPYELVRTLERSGCYIVDDDWMMVQRWYKGDVDTEGDPVRALVGAFLHRSPACPSIYLAEGEKGAELVQRARDVRAEGVLFAAPSFCDPALLDQPMTQAAVARAGLPHTSFLYSESTGQFQVIREQAGTFADSIKLS